MRQLNTYFKISHFLKDADFIEEEVVNPNHLIETERNATEQIVPMCYQEQLFRHK